MTMSAKLHFCVRRIVCVLAAVVVGAVVFNHSTGTANAMSWAGDCWGVALGTATTRDCTFQVLPGTQRFSIAGRLSSTCAASTEVVVANQILYAKMGGTLYVTSAYARPTLSTVATVLTSGVCYWVLTYEAQGFTEFVYRFVRPGTAARTLEVWYSEDAYYPYPGLGTMNVKVVNPVEEPVPVSGPLTDAELRASGVPVTGPQTDAQARASAQPVSGPLTDAQLRASGVAVTGPLTDTQLRASAVPVSGNWLTDALLRASPVEVEGEVTGGGGGGGGLGAEDQERLNLVWWGVWALVGLSLVALVAPRLHGAWSIRG